MRSERGTRLCNLGSLYLLGRLLHSETTHLKTRNPRMSKHFLLPLSDYQRIYQVAYSVLETTGIATTHRACLFFAGVGTLILRERYKLPATISAGLMAMMLDPATSTVMFYGRKQEDEYAADGDAFHAWVECNGWLIDFMAPIMGLALREDGHRMVVPSLMLQKRLVDAKPSPHHLEDAGDFFICHDRALTEELVSHQPIAFEDLSQVCLAWFKKPPKPLPKMALGDSHGSAKPLVARAPSISGAW